MFRFYVVFHKILFDSAYANLSKGTIQNHLRFLAVNTCITKQVPTELVPFIIQERNLSWYNAFLQSNKWFENSALLHVAKNKELSQPFSHVGFFQYDMDIDSELFSFVNTELASAEDPSKVLFYHKTEKALRHLHQIIYLGGWEIVLHLYNVKYNTSHKIIEIAESDIPLYNTFLVPSGLFQEMMEFTEFTASHLFEMMNFSTEHLPYHLERLHGVFLVCKRLEGVLPIWKEMPGLNHNASLKEACANARIEPN